MAVGRIIPMPKKHSKLSELATEVDLGAKGCRVQRLKAHVPSAAGAHKISVERARLLTEAYKETEGEPMSIRRAKALRKILNGITIELRPDELIVGSISRRGWVEVFPEYVWECIDQELDTTFKDRISDEDKAELREMHKYWKGKAIYDRVMSLWGEEIRLAEQRATYTRVPFCFSDIGHFAPNYEKILKLGLKGVIKQCEENLARHQYQRPEDLKRRYFWESVIIACRATLEFAGRYAAEAERQARLERNPARKAELKRIADICRHVPANPARNFHEVIQSFWFMHCIIQIEGNGAGISPGRFDQYMFPFYDYDLKSGKITRNQAKELLGCLWVKFTEPTILSETRSGRAKQLSGGTLFQNMIVGGQTSDGKDAVNDLSFLILDVARETRVVQPTLSLRYHDKLNEQFLLAALDVVRSGIGMPAFFNDKAYVPLLMRRGIPIQDARNLCFSSCVEPGIQGKTPPHMDSGHILPSKYLEFALHNGVDPMLGVQVGPKTGDPRKFKTFDELLHAFKEQCRYFSNLLHDNHNVLDFVHAEFTPVPFQSLMVDGCVESGVDCKELGGPYEVIYTLVMFLPNAVDSLMAIKKFVYDERKLSMDQLIKALDNNFEGQEDLRLMLRNKALKFGNDADEVDQLFVHLAHFLRDEINSHKNSRGTYFDYTSLTVAANVPYGARTCASAEGRCAGKPLADGGISPHEGADRKGPTAVLKSVSKIDSTTIGGALLNQKINPADIQGEEGLKRFAQVVKTFFALGGHHIQFNVVDRATLLDAQKHPDKHRDLIVRVAGYSAYWTQLDKDVQEHILARTEQRL